MNAGTFIQPQVIIHKMYNILLYMYIYIFFICARDMISL